MKHIYSTLMILGTLLLFSGQAWSASADKVVKSCKAAVTEAQGNTEAKASLMKIKPRGSSYETWFNISDGESDFKSYCFIKRGEIQELVTTEGRWTRNPKRPAVS